MLGVYKTTLNAFTFQRNLSCVCSQYCRNYGSKPLSVKEQKKLMYETLGDDQLEESIRSIRHKILFNSYIKFGLDIPKSYNERKLLVERQFSDSKVYDQISQDSSVPVSLKFLQNIDDKNDKNSPELGSNSDSGLNSSVPSEGTNAEGDNKTEEPISSDTIFPYQLRTKTSFISQDAETNILEEDGDFYDQSEQTNIKHWMHDYEVYDDSLEERPDIDPSYFEYGTADATIPASTVPCGGCGAHLHCQDPSIPGYLPREIYQPCTKPDLQSMICQRCHLLKNYNMALNVNVKAEDYPKLLEPLRKKKALVVLMVDMTDFPCSIWPGILNVIGVKRPIFVVGNKIDTIPGDQKGWLKQAEEALRNALPVQANVKDVTFISAKTGYGVEELITKIFKIWELRGDVYLVGCTNVGKSTLFNAFLHSDMCKSKASDLIRRATTSPWPGTTLNLLKFPILKPTLHEMRVRNRRLMARAKLDKKEKELHEEQKRIYEWKETGVKSLVGHIGRSFTRDKPISDENELSVLNINAKRLVSRDVFDEKSQLFAHGKWCYDTPGTVQPDQVIHLLTTEELVLTLPKKVIQPRVLHLRPGQTLFIAGLGRMDFLESTDNLSARFAVMASEKLPITACHTQDAEEVYSTMLGTKAFLVPSGTPERLSLWPALEGREITLVARPEPNSISADLVLSSAGWVAVNMVPGQTAKFHCWTPEGRGIHVRSTPLQKYVHLMRGKKPRDSPMYKTLEYDDDDEEIS